MQEIDRQVASFLEEWPDGSIVELGVGLDTRYERLGSPGVRWVELDLPRVSALRELVLPRGRRPRAVGTSITAPEWVASLPNGPICFTLEATLSYLPRGAMDLLLSRIASRGALARFVFDVGHWFDGARIDRVGPFQGRRDVGGLLAQRSGAWSVRERVRLLESTAVRGGTRNLAEVGHPGYEVTSLELGQPSARGLRCKKLVTPLGLEPKFSP